MWDHVLIGKFIGIWPTEKVLRGWITDKNRVLDGGSYFFNAARLHLRGWVERFNPDKEDLSWALVWIRLYSLPVEYWEEISLQEIGNVLGEFIKVAEETKIRRYTSYARICMYMNLNKALPDTVSLFHDDNEWIQLTDYEHVSFRCRRCHALRHLFRDCLLTQKPSPPGATNKSESDSFTKVPNRRRNHKKAAPNSRKP
eukprot:PITA_33842